MAGLTSLNRVDLKIHEILTLNFNHPSQQISTIPVYTPHTKEALLETMQLISEKNLKYGLIKNGSRHMIQKGKQEDVLVDMKYFDNITEFSEHYLRFEPGCAHQQILRCLNKNGIKTLKSIKITDLIKDDLPTNHLKNENKQESLTEIKIPVDKSIEPNKWICIGLQSFANIYNSLKILNEIKSTLYPMVCSISVVNRQMLKQVRNRYLINNSLNLLDLDFEVQMEGFQWFILIEAKCSEMTIPIINEFLSSKLGEIYHKHPLVKRWLFKMGMKMKSFKRQSLKRGNISKFELMEMNIKNDPVVLLKTYHMIHSIFQKDKLNLMMLIEIGDEELVMTIRSEFNNNIMRNETIRTFEKVSKS